MITLESFAEMLKNHDWFFNYSDDHRYYTKGREQRTAIDNAFKELTDQGFREEARDLYNSLSPDEFSMK